MSHCGYKRLFRPWSGSVRFAPESRHSIRDFRFLPDFVRFAPSSGRGRHPRRLSQADPERSFRQACLAQTFEQVVEIGRVFVGQDVGHIFRREVGLAAKHLRDRLAALIVISEVAERARVGKIRGDFGGGLADGLRRPF